MNRFTKRSLTGILWGAVAAAVLICFSDGIIGNDYWWHVRAGEWMVQNGRILMRNVFSWTAENQPWIAHEWLSEIIFYLLNAAFGENGIFFFSLSGSFLMTVLMAGANKEKFYDNFIFTGFYFGLFSVNAYMFFYGRPHVFGFFLLFAELFCIRSFFDHPDSLLIYGIPLLGMLWANLHGGSSNLSYLLLLFVLLSGLPVQKEIGRLRFFHFQKKQIFQLILILAETILAIGINPFGYKMLRYPYEQMADSFMTSVISEWAAPDAKNIGNILFFFIPVMLCVSGMLLSKKPIKVYHLLLMLFFLFLFLRSQRFMMLFYISSAFWAFDYLLPCGVKPVVKRSEKRMVILCLLLIGFAGVGYGGVRLISRLQSGEVIKKELSDDMIAFIKKDFPRALFNDYELGGYLIYHDIKVFYDGRADFHEEQGTFKDGVFLTFLVDGEENKERAGVDAEKIVEEYGINAFLIKNTFPLYVYLKSHAEKYELVREEGEIAYFKAVCSD